MCVRTDVCVHTHVRMCLFVCAHTRVSGHPGVHWCVPDLPCVVGPF